jgi:ribosomal protein S18 acetylase RimI-like enzyme
MDFTIRDMTLEDLKDVQDVAKTSWHATYEGIIPLSVQENFLKSAYNDEMMKARLVRSFLFVAEVTGKIVGFANFSPVNEEGDAELSAIYLSPEYQGKGIGTTLLNQGILKIDGVKKIYLNVEKENNIGVTFYEAKGFKQIEEFDEDFDGHILKTVRMVLNV